MATYVYCPVKKRVVLKGRDAASRQRSGSAGVQVITTGEHAADCRTVAHSLPRKEDGMDQFWHKFDSKGRAVTTCQSDRRELEARLEGRYKWDR